MYCIHLGSSSVHCTIHVYVEMSERQCWLNNKHYLLYDDVILGHTVIRVCILIFDGVSVSHSWSCLILVLSDIKELEY